jgi:hypothetical protein
MSERRLDDKRAIFADSYISVHPPLPSKNGDWEREKNEKVGI